MSRIQAVRHEFVEFVPESMDEGVLYVSIRYRTAVHLCCCGCGTEIATPISPADWQLTFDGETISLHPSIGNWSLPCRSHYWLRENRVIWARQWTTKEIAKARIRDGLAVERRFAGETPDQGGKRESLWQRLRGKLP